MTYNFIIIIIAHLYCYDKNVLAVRQYRPVNKNNVIKKQRLYTSIIHCATEN